MRRSILVILGIVFLGFTGNNLFAQPTKEMRMEMMKDRIADKLNLSEEQQSSIEELKLQHQKAMISLKAEMEQKKLDIKEMKLKGNYNREQYVAEIRDLNLIRDKIEIAKAEHQMDVYELLNDEQKATWNKMHDKFGEHRKERMDMRREKHMGPPKDID